MTVTSHKTHTHDTTVGDQKNSNCLHSKGRHQTISSTVHLAVTNTRWVLATPVAGWVVLFLQSQL